jgi:type IV pilus assembly protein PilB
VYGEKIVMRLLDKNALRPSPDSLGLLPRDLRVLKDKINAPYGLVMLCGPTGSGKTTTLYSCLGAIDTVRKNVLTVEDPVEYRMNGVHQMQVNERIGLDFASGLRTILRQDPDVIMVGECRDKPTSAMAIQASLTGHVVFSTIHTNDAVGVVTRMIDLGIEPFLVASSLTLAIAQRLVRVLCPSCKISVDGEKVLENLLREGVSREKLEQLGIEIDPYTSYSEARGCVHCRDMGYNGRIAVFEVFEMTAEARSVIASPGFQESDLRALAARSGMTTLVRHGMTLIDSEVTTLSEIVRVLGESS